MKTNSIIKNCKIKKIKNLSYVKITTTALLPQDANSKVLPDVLLINLF